MQQQREHWQYNNNAQLYNITFHKIITKIKPLFLNQWKVFQHIYHTFKARSHKALALALAATLRNGYRTHSVCSVSVTANANALCE